MGVGLFSSRKIFQSSIGQNPKTESYLFLFIFFFNQGNEKHDFIIETIFNILLTNLNSYRNQKNHNAPLF